VWAYIFFLKQNYRKTLDYQKKIRRIFVDIVVELGVKKTNIKKNW